MEQLLQNITDYQFYPSKRSFIFTANSPLIDYFLTFMAFLPVMLLLTRQKSPNFVKNLNKKRSMSVVHDINKIKNVSQIPFKSSFSLGIRMPFVVELINLLRSYKKVGLNFCLMLHKNGGPIFKVPNFGGNAFTVADPSLIQKILCSADDRLLNKPKFWYDLFMDCFQNGLGTAPVDVWRLHRKVLGWCFTVKSYEAYLKLVNKHSNKIVSSVDDLCRKNGCAEGRPLLKAFRAPVFNIIKEMLLGEGTFSEEESQKFHEHLVEIYKLVKVKLTHPQNLFPLIWSFNPKSKVYDYHVSEVKALVSKGIKKCRDMLDLKEEMQTGLQDVCYNNGETCVDDSVPPTVTESILVKLLKCNASDNEIFDEIGQFLIAGHETTYFSMHSFLQLIAENPQYQKLCQAEVDEIFSTKETTPGQNVEDLSTDDLFKLKYLERCILETIRFIPAVPVIARELLSGMKLNGIRFKKGSIFVIMPWAIHRDPKNFPNPEVFDPDRFLPENREKRHSHAYIPFSSGPRGCIGNKFAMMEMKTVLAKILHKFDVHTNDKFSDVKFYMAGSAVPERSFQFWLKKRNRD